MDKFLGLEYKFCLYNVVSSVRGNIRDIISVNKDTLLIGAFEKQNRLINKNKFLIDNISDK